MTNDKIDAIERVILKKDPDIPIVVIREHLLRYVLALESVIDKDVLDLACGSGYGMYLMSYFAKSVSGYDYSQEAINEAKKFSYKCDCCLELRNLEEDKPLSNHKHSKFDVVTCFPKGTPVYTEEGVEEIDKININKKVWGEDGSLHKVTRLFKRKYSGELIELKIGSLPIISVTPNHLILTYSYKRKHTKNNLNSKKSEYKHLFLNPLWKKAEEITIRDRVAVPFFNDLKKHKDKKILFRSGNKNKNNKDNREFKNVSIDNDLSYLFGLWLAEGTSNPSQGKFVFHLGSTELNLYEKIKKVLSKYNINCNININKNQHSALNIVCYNSDIAQFLIDNFSKGALNKKIPEWLYKCKTDIIKSFINGWLDGDGDKNNREYRIATVSKNAAYGLIKLMYKLGFSACLAKTKLPLSNTIGKNTFGNNGYVYEIGFVKKLFDDYKKYSDKKQKRISFSWGKFDNDKIFLRVNGIRIINNVKNIDVYNIEVENIHSYCLPIIVHNCFETIEHVNNPKTLLKNIKNCLNLNAIVYISTPNDLKCTDKNKWHKVHFDFYSLYGTIQEVFRDVEVKIFGQDQYGMTDDITKPYIVARINL